MQVPHCFLFAKKCDMPKKPENEWSANQSVYDIFILLNCISVTLESNNSTKLLLKVQSAKAIGEFAFSVSLCSLT